MNTREGMRPLPLDTPRTPEVCESARRSRRICAEFLAICRVLDPTQRPGYEASVNPLGNFIGGAFVSPSGPALVSRDPAADGAVVFETGGDPAAVALACEAAAAAAPAWSRRTMAERADLLARWKDAIAARAKD